MCEMLVEAKRGTADIGPAGAVVVVGTGLSHAGKFIGGVDVVVRAAAAVESELMPYSAGSVVREKEYKCVFQLPVVAQCFDKAADIAIHDVDHGCINSHTAC